MTVVFRDDQFIPIQGHYAVDVASRPRRWSAPARCSSTASTTSTCCASWSARSTRVSAQHGELPRPRRHRGRRQRDAACSPDGAIGTLTSVWHDNLARPSLRRVEIFCERRYIVIEGDDWFGPVHWTDADGTAGSLDGDEIVAAVEPLVDGSLNPDGEFVRAVVEGRPATPTSPPPSRPTASSTRCTARRRRTARRWRSHDDHRRSSPIDQADTYALRRSVLRDGDPGGDVAWDEDAWPGTVHLGVRIDGELVGTSTWIPRAMPGDDDDRCGLAAARHGHGRRAARWRPGGILVEAGCQRCAGAGGRAGVGQGARRCARLLRRPRVRGRRRRLRRRRRRSCPTTSCAAPSAEADLVAPRDPASRTVLSAPGPRQPRSARSQRN